MSQPRRPHLPHQHLANDLADAGFRVSIQVGSDTLTGYAVPTTPTPAQVIAQQLRAAAKQLPPNAYGILVMDLDGVTDGQVHPIHAGTVLPTHAAGFRLWFVRGATPDARGVTPDEVEALRRCVDTLDPTHVLYVWSTESSP